jgi:nicotinate-nucleotide adenylyltransferase
VWIPAGVPPHREVEQDPGPEARYEMVELTVGADERFAASRIEIDREGPSYMADTLRELHSRSPGDELVLLLGGDQASTLGSWHEPEEIFKLATVAVVERTGFHREAIAVKLSSLLRGDKRIRFFDMPRVDVSSSMIRRRARSGLPIRYLVTDKVANFIGAQSLYGASVPVPVEAGE